MSRTYRRKNSYQEFYVTFENERFCDGCWGATTRRYLEGKELKKALAQYHNDTEWWNWGVPAEFVRLKNRELRSKNKAILRNAIRDGNDEPMFIPYVKDAAYDYW